MLALWGWGWGWAGGHMQGEGEVQQHRLTQTYCRMGATMHAAQVTILRIVWSQCTPPLPPARAGFGLGGWGTASHLSVLT
jgi:hypothetical protein